jgi:hypothetical protein
MSDARRLKLAGSGCIRDMIEELLVDGQNVATADLGRLR